MSTTGDYVYTDKEGVERTESVTVEWYAKCLTPAFLQAILDLSKEGSGSIKEISRHLSKSIKSWSVEWQEEGKEAEAFPPSYENLSEVCDQEFINWLVGEASEVFQGNQKKPKESANGSVPAESSAMPASSGM